MISDTNAVPAILYIYGESLPNRSANSGAVIGLCSALTTKVGNVQIALPEAGSGSPADIGTSYHLHPDVRFLRLRVPANSRRYPALAAAVRHAERGVVVITRMPQVAILTALLGKPTILELHQAPETFKHWKFWRRGLRLLRRNRLRIAPLSQGVADSLDPLTRTWLDPRIIGSAARDFRHLAGEPARYDVGFVGSFMPGKGVEIVEKLASAMPDRSFILYGDPAMNPVAAERVALLPNVTLGGYVHPSTIEKAFASFKVGLAPYEAAGFGKPGSSFIQASNLSSLKVVEYMSAGRIIVASRISAIEATLQHRHSGILCAPGDVADWKQALTEIFEEPEWASSLARNAMDRYEQEFSFDTRAARFLEIAAEIA